MPDTWYELKASVGRLASPGALVRARVELVFGLHPERAGEVIQELLMSCEKVYHAERGFEEELKRKGRS